MKEGYDGLVMIRCKNPDGKIRPNVLIKDVPDDLSKDYYLTHMTPIRNRVINGELWDGPGGLYLHWSPMQTHLREGLEKDGRHATGITARAILKWACNENDYDDLLILLETYPEHVIEFTAYEDVIGDRPDRRTIIWEVRAY